MMCWTGAISVHTHIMPYLEMGPAYNQFDFANSRVRVPPLGPPNCPQNLAIVQVPFALFVCPSEARKISGVAMNNYRYNGGVTFCPAEPWFDSSQNQNPWSTNCANELNGPTGGFFGDRPFTAAAILDGLSNTAAFSERILGDLDNSVLRYGDFRRTVPQQPTETTASIVSWCTTRSPTEPHTSDQGIGDGAWTYGHHHRTIYNHLLTPNAAIYDCSTNVSFVDGNNEGAIVTARSFHPGIVNAMLGDGSVRTVSNTISLPVWRAVGTRAGSEALSNF
jgi:hypothetical protein